MTQATKVTLNQSVETSVPEAPGKGRNSIITSIPTKENAIIAKFVCDPTYDNGRKVYRPVNYYSHPTGETEKDKSSHVCLTFFGAKSSPENDAYWDYTMRLSALRKAGQGNSDEAKKLATLKKTFQPSKKGYILIVRPGSPVVEALRISSTVIDQLMGRKKDDYNEEIVSLLDTMKSKGVSPFDLRNSKGWVKIYKTGEGIGTRYHVEQALVEKEDETKDGRKIKYMDDFTAEVHSHILSDDFDISEIPDVQKFEKARAWSVQESTTFVENLGTLKGVPEWCLKSNKKAEEQPQGGESTADVETAGSADYQTVSEDEIPF